MTATTGALRVLVTEPTVETSTWSDVRDTAQRIMSDAMYAGERPTMPECIAAAFSVPHGAPLAMAVANLGCALHDDDARRYSEARDRFDRSVKRAIYGRR